MELTRRIGVHKGQHVGRLEAYQSAACLDIASAVSDQSTQVLGQLQFSSSDNGNSLSTTHSTSTRSSPAVEYACDSTAQTSQSYAAAGCWLNIVTADSGLNYQLYDWTLHGKQRQLRHPQQLSARTIVLLLWSFTACKYCPPSQLIHWFLTQIAPDVCWLTFTQVGQLKHALAKWHCSPKVLFAAGLATWDAPGCQPQGAAMLSCVIGCMAPMMLTPAVSKYQQANSHFSVEWPGTSSQQHANDGESDAGLPSVADMHHALQGAMSPLQASTAVSPQLNGDSSGAASTIDATFDQCCNFMASICDRLCGDHDFADRLTAEQMNALLWGAARLGVQHPGLRDSAMQRLMQMTITSLAKLGADQTVCLVWAAAVIQVWLHT